MRKLSRSVLSLLLLAATILLTPGESGAEGATGNQLSSESPWPIRFTASDSEFVVYPPHFDEWRDRRLRGRAAVSVQPEGADRPSFGTVWLSARTRRDAASRTVHVDDVEVEQAEFPAAPEWSDDYLAVLRERLAAKTWQVAEQRLQSDMAIDRAARQARSVALKNNPPRIIFAQEPSILVPIDGTPVLRDVQGTQLLRVMNTRALVLLDKTAGRYYLRVAGRWMSARSLDGPWSESADTTGELERAGQIARRQGQVDLLDEEETVAAAPIVHVATSAAELLQTDGPPEYSPIEGTQLLYLTNSPDYIFLDLRTQRYFVLISGRWYRAAELAGGRWQFVPGSELPADFASIPLDHPMALVRASVPGTPQAREAVVASQAPQVATIRREAARIELTYDGEPEFGPIEGTPLHYAVNAPIPVIRVSADEYYALDNGVWFTARFPYGTWTVASYVPPVIYTIPFSSPLHYVTYVRIYHDTPETVDVGYTSGYAGSYVSPDYVVVYGSGWYYRPWIGYYWYGSPFTWGYGFTFFYTWWYPWGPPRFVAWRPYPCYRPWWGPWVVVRHTWIHNTVVNVQQTVVVKHSRNVARIYDRWGPEVVARDRSIKGRTFERTAHSPLRPGEGYIVKDGRRFDLATRNAGRRAWQEEDRSSLPTIQGTHRHAEKRSAGKSDNATRGSSDTTPRASLPPRSALRDRDPMQSTPSPPWSRQRNMREGRPEPRAVPERRALPGPVLRHGNGAGRPDVPAARPEARPEGVRPLVPGRGVEAKAHGEWPTSEPELPRARVQRELLRPAPQSPERRGFAPATAQKQRGFAFGSKDR